MMIRKQNTNELKGYTKSAFSTYLGSKKNYDCVLIYASKPWVNLRDLYLVAPL
jgi:hypothetical protein